MASFATHGEDWRPKQSTPADHRNTHINWSRANEREIFPWTYSSKEFIQPGLPNLLHTPKSLVQFLV